ncbi:hypothetical protein Tco_0020874 [Tanacetum coccineum]
MEKGKARMETVPGKDYILLPMWPADPLFSQSSKDSPDAGFNHQGMKIVSPTVNAAGIEDNAVDENIVYRCADDPNMHELEDIVYSDDDKVVGAEADMNNLDTFMPQRTNQKDFQNYLFACFLSQEEPKKVTQTLKDPSWVEAMQEELLQFKLQQVWTLMDLPNSKRSIGTKWVYRNKKDERVARIEAIGLFLAYALFKDFVVYQMDVKSDFLYGKIE